jgi:hypothetical protein
MEDFNEPCGCFLFHSRFKKFRKQCISLFPPRAHQPLAGMYTLTCLQFSAEKRAKIEPWTKLRQANHIILDHQLCAEDVRKAYKSINISEKYQFCARSNFRSSTDACQVRPSSHKLASIIRFIYDWFENTFWQKISLGVSGDREMEDNAKKSYLESCSNRALVKVNPFD